MSVILDALKKAQESRKRQAAPASSSQKQTGASHKRLFAWVGAAALALVVALVVAFVLFSGSTTKDVAKVAAPVAATAVAPVGTAGPAPAKPPTPAALSDKKPPTVPQEARKPQEQPPAKEKSDWRTDKFVADTDKAPATGPRKAPRSRSPSKVEATASPQRPAETDPYDSRKRQARRDIQESASRREQSAFDAAQDRAAMLVETGKLGDARQAYAKLLVEQPNHPEILNNLGVIALRERRLDEAIFYFSKALGAKKDYPKALNNIGLTLMAQGEHGEAEKYFRRAIAGEPDSAEPRLNLAALLRKQGRFEDASNLLKGLVEKNSPLPHIALSYALIRDDAGDKAGAIRYYRQYLVNAPFGQERTAVVERLKVLENVQSPGSR